MLDMLKGKATNTAAKTVVTARSVVKQGFDTAKGKLEAAKAGPGTKLDITAVKKKLAAAGSTVKLHAGTVKGKCEMATAGTAAKLDVGTVKDKLKTAGLVLKLEAFEAGSAVKGKCDATATEAARLLGSTIPGYKRSGQTSNPECVEQLLSMGFAPKDILRAMHERGSEDVAAVISFLCQDQAGEVRSRRERVAGTIARRMNELDADEDEDVQIALQLSRLQAEAAARRSCRVVEAMTPGDVQHATAQEAAVSEQTCNIDSTASATPWALRPSVGTWLMPIAATSDVGSTEGIPHATGDVAVASAPVASAAKLTDSSAGALAKQENAENAGAVAMHGAVRCGA